MRTLEKNTRPATVLDEQEVPWLQAAQKSELKINKSPGFPGVHFTYLN
jgi:hypothetical protein